MKTGGGGAIAGQSSMAAKGLRPLERLPDWLSRQRRCFSVMVLSAAVGLSLSGWVLQAVGVLASPAASWLALCTTSMAVLALAGVAFLERRLVRQLLQLLDALQSEQHSADAWRVWQREISASLQQAGHPAELAQRLLSGLAPRLPFQQGLCCYWDEQRQSLQAAARYGGEGVDPPAVLGQTPLLAPLLLEAVRSRREIVMDQPGPGYLRISSGLGDAEPAQLLVLPLEYQGRLFGVLELAALQPVADAARELLPDVVPVLALCLGRLNSAGCPDTAPTSSAGLACIPEVRM
jgi:hypothetical protein